MKHTSSGESVKVHGPALRHVREAAGRSIASLARAADVSTSFLSQIERGVRPGTSREVFDVLVRELDVKDERVLMHNPARAPQALVAA